MILSALDPGGMIYTRAFWYSEAQTVNMHKNKPPGRARFSPLPMIPRLLWGVCLKGDACFCSYISSCFFRVRGPSGIYWDSWAERKWFVFIVDVKIRILDQRANHADWDRNSVASEKHGRTTKVVFEIAGKIFELGMAYSFSYMVGVNHTDQSPVNTCHNLQDEVRSQFLDLPLPVAARVRAQEVIRVIDSFWTFFGVILSEQSKAPDVVGFFTRRTCRKLARRAPDRQNGAWRQPNCCRYILL